MCDFQFAFKTKTLKGSVKYGCGQPMGLYSSWPAMALTNHVLVRLAATNLGKDNFQRYMIIGDDVVIYDKYVAIEYIHILNQMGVEYSLDDTI